MKSKPIFIGIILLILLSGKITYASTYEITSNNIIYVDDDNKYGPWGGTKEHPYRNIHDGLNVTSDGDTIFVYNGTYKEYDIHIKNSIFLVGEDKTNTIIEVQMIFMNSAYSSISGFNIRYCNVVSENQDYFDIYNNNITGGISIVGTIDSHIHHNIINGIDGPEPAIKISEGCCTNIEFNVINSNYEGGIAVFGNGNTISDNIITYDNGESGYGIRLEGNNNKIRDNHIANNVFGIRLDYAYGNKIVGNNFIDNKVYVYLFGASDTLRKPKNIWINNFWGRPRMSPKLILGIDMIPFPKSGDIIFWIPILVIQFDWHPRLIPNDIPKHDL